MPLPTGTVGTPCHSSHVPHTSQECSEVSETRSQLYRCIAPYGHAEGEHYFVGQIV